MKQQPPLGNNRNNPSCFRWLLPFSCAPLLAGTSQRQLLSTIAKSLLLVAVGMAQPDQLSHAVLTEDHPTSNRR